MKSSDRLNAVIDAEIEGASMFVVNFFIGRKPGDAFVKRSSLYERHEFPVSHYPTRSEALRAARTLVEERGTVRYGHRGMIYAICRESQISNFVDANFELLVDGGRRVMTGYK